jgi:D-aminopeptidase
VVGVEVGHVTLISGEGKLVVGKGPVRTGVTTIFPRGRASLDPVFAGWFSLNGNGEMTGTAWVEESGFLEGPITITNTHSVGVARDAVIEWLLRRPTAQPWGLPVVTETYDGLLNDVNGFHVKAEHVVAALEGAKSGAVSEGGVGGGTGMICFDFKGGIGTASRKLDGKAGGYTVGVLVQANFGQRRELRIAGAPVGQEIGDLMPCASDAGTAQGFAADLPPCADGRAASSGKRRGRTGSIIVVVATDAPVLPHQLRKLAIRAGLGVGRSGGHAENGSGDLMIAFSTANRAAAVEKGVASIEMLPNARLDPLFYATVQATEEAIVNAMVAGETMTGANGVRVFGLPHDRLQAVLRKYNRLA